ncbi:MAG: aminotransferase class V-fold PLP-dependent enzyme [FCB group bacterium]|jgi:selenocysteine lyase/cysteine desulfurase
MLANRRDFVKSFGLLLGTAPFLTYLNLNAKVLAKEALDKADSMSDSEASKNEDFWAWVQESYTASPNIINLNNGGVSPQPKVVQDAFERYYRMCNEAPSYYMWRILDQGREPLRMKLANLAGCSAEELAINRNSTESLATIILGLNLKKGDEVVLTKQDYPNVINTWKMREKRDGIKLKWVNFNFPIENDEEIVSQFENAFTPNTRIVNITHIINWIGQILPARKIADAAHKKGIEVMVDAAHTFAHIDYKIPDLDCDYFGTSLHKWLCAPFGTGLLYIKKDKIKNVLPIFANGEPESGDIRKFESLGTRNFATEQAIGNAINFHNAIGSKRKEERLRFLKNYWAEKAAKIDKVKIHTSFKPEYSCALCLVSVDGVKSADVSNTLFDKYKIHTVGIEWENISGVRVTPHVYTTLPDLDRLLVGLEDIAKSK